MSAASNPFGAQPRFHPSGNLRAQQIPAGLAASYGSAIYQNSPVILATDGTATIGTTAADWIGTFAGVEYTDSNGRRQFSKYWPGAITGATDIVVWVYRDPVTVFEIQCSGSLAQTSIGDQADFVNPGTGNTVPGLSTAQINSTLAGAGVNKQMRIVDLARNPDNAWGDAYTNVMVENARHQYVAIKNAI